jgi:hypothetical protein
MCVAFPELGHGSIARLPHFEEFDYIPQYRENPEIEAYFRKVYEDRVRNLGDTMRATGQATSTIFPNMSFHSLQPRSIGVFHPISPTETEMWRIYLVDKDAPDAVKDATYYRPTGRGAEAEYAARLDRIKAILDGGDARPPAGGA